MDDLDALKQILGSYAGKIRCIYIDDNEQANFKLMCDEVLGEENFINEFTWGKNLIGRQISGVGAAKTKESILCYSKQILENNIFEVNIDFAKEKMKLY